LDGELELGNGGVSGVYSGVLLNVGQCLDARSTLSFEVEEGENYFGLG
jgi:hypothetical protein